MGRRCVCLEDGKGKGVNQDEGVLSKFGLGGFERRIVACLEIWTVAFGLVMVGVIHSCQFGLGGLREG